MPYGEDNTKIIKSGFNNSKERINVRSSVFSCTELTKNIDGDIFVASAFCRKSDSKLFFKMMSGPGEHEYKPFNSKEPESNKIFSAAIVKYNSLTSPAVETFPLSIEEIKSKVGEFFTISMFAGKKDPSKVWMSIESASNEYYREYTPKPINQTDNKQGSIPFANGSRY